MHDGEWFEAHISIISLYCHLKSMSQLYLLYATKSMVYASYINKRYCVYRYFRHFRL